MELFHSKDCGVFSGVRGGTGDLYRGRGGKGIFCERRSHKTKGEKP